jgi:serine phosphatase RsbU (regulator of sigma subunit)
MAGGAPNTDAAELSLASDVMTISAVACPLKSAQTYTDLLYVLFPPEYGTPEWLALTSLVAKQFQQAESTWEARKLGEDHAAIERELNRANSIQKRLVPKDIHIPTLDYAIGFTPCRWVGGDYVDVVRGGGPGSERVLLTIADVCGKGLPAALVASSLHMLTHTAMRAGSSLPSIMQNLNVYLAESLSEGTFVTMLSAMLTLPTGELEIINAGHPAGLFIKPDGEVSLTQQGANLPLGLDPECNLIAETTKLPNDSYLILFTDGLSELPVANGELLGEDALAADIASIVKSSPPPATSVDISNRLTQLLDSLQEGMSRDDRTFLVARRI